MTYKSYVSFLFLVLAIVVIDARVAYACSCFPAGPVLDAYDNATQVLIVKVVSVEKAEEGSKYVNGIRSTTVKVERVFKGELKVGDEMVFGQGGGADCVWTFDEDDAGVEFLFYLSVQDKNPRLWYARECGRSTGVKSAANDLLYLENMEKVRGKTRISGTVYSLNNQDVNLFGMKIRIIRRNKTFEVKTNSDGVYELYDAPPGEYLIEPEIPLGYKLDPNRNRPSLSYAVDKDGVSRGRIPITLEAKKHVNLDLQVIVDNAFRGKGYDPNGIVTSGVWKNVIPVDNINSSLYRVDCTNPNSSY